MLSVSVTNAPKDQHLESGGDELPEVSWRHQQQPSYAPPISSAADPYSAAGLYIIHFDDFTGLGQVTYFLQ